MSNSTNQSFINLSQPPLKEPQYLLSTIYCILMITGLIMNILIIYIITKKKLLKRSINYYIYNMAVSDILLSCCGISVKFSKTVTNSVTWYISGVPGIITCKFVYFISNVSTLVSTLSLVFMSLERFFAIAYPTKTNLRTGKVRRVLLVLTWLIPVLFYAKNFYSWRLLARSCGEFWGVKHHKYAMDIIHNFYTVAFIFIPLVVLVVLYGVIIISLQKQQKFHQNVIPNSQQRIRQKQRKRINILAFIIVLAFALCYSPMYFYVYIVHSFVNQWKYNSSENFQKMIKLSYVFAYSNATINPLICIVFNREMRKAVKGMMPRCFRQPFRSRSFDFKMSSIMLSSRSSVRTLDFDQSRSPVTTNSIHRYEESGPM